MEMLNLKGCGTAMITPFKGAEVDYEAYAALVDRQVVSGVHFIVALATTSETPTLSLEEKIKLLQITKEHAAGRPVVAGCGTNSLTATLENMRLLEPYGPDAWLVVVPYYNKPTQEGQYQYFKAVAAATSKPVVMYNVPGRTGSSMTAETAVRIARECPNVIAIKEASGNFALASEIIRTAPEGFQVLCGDDDMTIALMAAGAAGVVSVASNVAPAEVSQLAEAMLAGDLKKARELHHRLFPLFRNCFVESSPIPAKAALAQMGLISNELRLPLVPACVKTEEIMAQTIKDLWK